MRIVNVSEITIELLWDSVVHKIAPKEVLTFEGGVALHFIDTNNGNIVGFTDDVEEEPVSCDVEEEPVSCDVDTEELNASDEFICDVCGFVAKSALGLHSHKRSHIEK